MAVPIERDQELVDLIEAKNSEFWSYVASDAMPPLPAPEEIPDVPRVSEGEVTKMESSEWSWAVSMFREAKALLSEAKSLEDEAKAAIQGLMGAAEVAEGDNLRVYWKEQRGRVTVDGKRLRQDHPEIWEQYKRVGKPFRSFRPYFLKEVGYGE